MKKNMGLLDKGLRIAVAIAIGILVATKVVMGTWAIVLAAIAVVFLATSFINFCPLYLPFGINTSKNKNK
ncbi:DUF2892 domain-containing protein [Parasediminibacterium sp. JCM 36343]|uniref:YgaP family membrane protein n=1 Tax=Parasediminibacterium sp. JCM 36343 TaxID=3374279 RepID=UPI00397B1811